MKQIHKYPQKAPNRFRWIKSERGAAMVEAVFPIFLFFMTVFMMIELCRYGYMMLTSQFAVTRAVRAASTGAASSEGETCCEKRINAVKEELNQYAGSFLLSFEDEEIFVCERVGGARVCDLCATTPSGLLGRKIIEVSVERDTSFLLIPGVFTVEARAFTRAEPFKGCS